MVKLVQQNNDRLQQKLAELVHRLVEFPDGLITVSYLRLGDSSHEILVGISVLPINFYGTALQQLRKKSAVIAQIATKECRLSKIPKLIWQIDSTNEQADQLNRLIDSLN